MGLTCAIAGTTGASAAPVLAGPPAPVAPADPAAMLRRGTELYKAGVYDKAATAFQAAFEAAPSPTTALNLALSLEGAGRPDDAVRWYEKVLFLDAENPGPRRDSAEAGRAHLKTHGYVSVTCGPPGAALAVDGEPKGNCPSWGGYLPAGPHGVTLTSVGRKAYNGTVSLHGAERTELTLDLPLEVQVASPSPAPVDPAADAVRADPPPPAPADAGPVVPRWVAYTLLGVGGAGLIAGGVYYGIASGDASDAPTGASVAARRRHDQAKSDFETHRNLAYGAGGAGAALALGGGLLLLLGGDF